MDRMQARLLLVLVTGAVPGLGKSSLAKALAGWLRIDGEDVELFEEQQILDRPEFASLVEEWLSTGSAGEQTLIECASAYLRWCDNRGAGVYILDSLFPHLPSLLAWRWSDAEIRTFFGNLASRMSNCGVIELHLIGDAGLGLQRAVDREGDGWLDRFVRKVGGYADIQRDVRTPEDVVDYLERAAERSRRLLQQAPWTVHFIDADLGVESALAAALDVLPSPRRERGPG